MSHTTDKLTRSQWAESCNEIRTVLADLDRRCARDQYAGRFLQEETEDTEMTEVNRLVAFSPPLRFPLFALVSLFSRTARGVASETPVSFSEESRNKLSVPFCVPLVPLALPLPVLNRLSTLRNEHWQSQWSNKRRNACRCSHEILSQPRSSFVTKHADIVFNKRRLSCDDTLVG